MKIFARKFIKYWIIALVVLAGIGIFVYRAQVRKHNAKIEQQKETLEKAKARYEAEKDALAELVKMRNELRKEELMDAVINSSRSYEEILAFVKGEGLTE